MSRSHRPAFICEPACGAVRRKKLHTLPLPCLGFGRSVLQSESWSKVKGLGTGERGRRGGREGKGRGENDVPERRS